MVAYDLNEKALDSLVSAGAQKGQSCAQVAKSCDVIVTMLPNSPDVEKAVLSEEGILKGTRKGQILIDMSSIAPLVSQSLAQKLAQKGVDMLDAPVSGGQEKAQSGTLAIMVGGKEEVFNQCKAIL